MRADEIEGENLQKRYQIKTLEHTRVIKSRHDGVDSDKHLV